MRKTYLDTETCGLHSMPVLIQYALDDGPICLYDIWLEPVGKTVDLIESFLPTCIVGFNLAFDWFQINKLYSIWTLLPRDWIPVEHINEIADLEPQGRDGFIVKPASALDLMLHGRKGPLQSLMSRGDITVRRVPAVLANDLAIELEQRVEIDGIYFAKRKDQEAPKWKVYDVVGRDGNINPDFKDVVLKFNPSGGLKYIVEHILGIKPKYHYEDVEPNKDWYPYEIGYAPFAKAVSNDDWEVIEDGKCVGHAWPACIRDFIKHWSTNENAREYASDDITYTRLLDAHFGHPTHGDDDSILSIMVSIVRWRGFRIDLEGIREQREKAAKIVNAAPVMITSPTRVREYIEAVMDSTEALALSDTGKDTLRSIRSWIVDSPEECSKCDGVGCERCMDGTFIGVGQPTPKLGNHPAALRSNEMLGAKMAIKEVELYDKLLLAGRFHASFQVIGTLSSRMSGGDGLNAQGIKATKEVRRLFPLAWEGAVLSGGDFDAFEVTLADAVYGDEQLRTDLLDGKKIHALLAMCMYEGTTYEQIMDSQGTDDDMYVDGKRGIFGIFYGGDEGTLVRNIGITPEAAKRTFEAFGARYKGFNRCRTEVFEKFSAIHQPGGLGTGVLWKEPAEYVESFLGFRRYFSLEWKIIKALFELARAPTPRLKNAKIHVMRSTGRVQTAGGAVASALYGAAFGLQGKIQRAAGNHLIQSPGGAITKHVQRLVWDLQPVGKGELLVAPMNIHDELDVVNHPSMTDEVCDAVAKGVESFRNKVPLIGMSWFKEMLNWAEKKSGQAKVSITHKGIQEVHEDDN
jgi:hypothetical protein